MGLDGDPELEETEASMITWIWTEITSSYLNLGLILAIVYLLYKILFVQKDEDSIVNVEPPIPPMKKQVNYEPLSSEVSISNACVKRFNNE